MSEQFLQNASEKPIRPYFEGANSSREFLAAKRFVENYIDTHKIEIDLSEDNIDGVRNEITRLGKRLLPGADVDGIVQELRNAEIITPAKKVIHEKQPEFLETKYVTLEKPREVIVDEEELKIVEANLLFEELQKANIFKNPEELERIYELSSGLRETKEETEEYYFEFAHLVKGGKDEVENDLRALRDRKQDFETIKQHKDPAEVEREEYAKKIATITERAFSHAVTAHEWYGKNVTVENVSEFDDVKRGVDRMFEIRKEDEESGFLALAIDVTFRGLESEEFKKKFFKLLESIADGHRTKVKYFKNHKGEPMKEFAVPKIVLYFNTDDVKDMVDILKHPERAAESKQKANILNQVIQSCEILAAFAEEYQNGIFRRYIATINSFKEQAWKNEEVKRILESKKDTAVTKHLRALVDEFKLTYQAKHAA